MAKQIMVEATMWKINALLSTLKTVVKLSKKSSTDMDELKKEIMKARIEIKAETLKIINDINTKLNELEEMIDEGNTSQQKGG